MRRGFAPGRASGTARDVETRAEPLEGVVRTGVAGTAAARTGVGWRAVARRIRLGSGLVLFAYVLTHLLTHAAGTISLDAANAALSVTGPLWGRAPLKQLLYGALLLHIGFALASLWGRRHLRLPMREVVQWTLGALIPPVLAGHVAGTRYAFEWLDLPVDYTRVMAALWVAAPGRGVVQALLLVITWVHGCIGLHHWLRHRAWYQGAAPLLLVLAVAIPLQALAGYVAMGVAVVHLAENAAWLAQHRLAPEASAAIGRVETAILWLLFVLFGGVALGRMVRSLRDRLSNSFTVTYPDGTRVRVPRGASVLEASRFGGIPHASSCGGQGRCSTCRVRVLRGLDALPAPEPDEARLLARVKAEPDVRLACRLRPTGDVAVVPLLPERTVAADDLDVPVPASGAERQVAVLFCDIRGSTQLAERRVPYDIVFLLNQYFDAVGRAVDEAGGRSNHFAGDEVMALFGIEDRPDEGSRAAIAAAAGIGERIAQLNRSFGGALGADLRVGIGVHVGPAIVGRMGYGSHMPMTAIGDTMNAAKRIEDLTKTFGTELVVSAEAARRAGLRLDGLPVETVTLRGRDRPVEVVPIARAADARARLPDLPMPRRRAGASRLVRRLRRLRFR